MAVLLNDLGNTLAAQGNASDASRAYMESALLARETGQSALSMTALINAAMASIDDGQFAQAKDRLELAYQQLHELPDSHDKAFGLLNLALGYEDLRPQISPERTLLVQLDPAALPGSRGIRHQPQQVASSADAPRTAQPPNDRSSLTVRPPNAPTESDQQLFRARSEQFLREAAAIATRIGDPTAESYALGYLGQWYEQARPVPRSPRLDAPGGVCRATGQCARVPVSLALANRSDPGRDRETGRRDQGLSPRRQHSATDPP